MQDNANRAPDPEILLVYLARVAFAIVITTVTWLALVRDPPAAADLGWDKLNHVAAFTVLAGLSWFARLIPVKPRYWGYFLVMTYGVVLECVQLMTVNRVFEWTDIMADAFGIVLYIVVLHPIARRLPVLKSLMADS